MNEEVSNFANGEENETNEDGIARDEYRRAIDLMFRAFDEKNFADAERYATEALRIVPDDPTASWALGLAKKKRPGANSTQENREVASDSKGFASRAPERSLEPDEEAPLALDSDSGGENSEVLASKVRDVLSEARALAARGAFEDARDKAKEALRVDPSNADAQETARDLTALVQSRSARDLLIEARRLLMEDKPNEAIEKAKIARRLDPELKERARAIRRDALARRKESLIERAQKALDRLDDKEATKLASKALKIDPKSKRAHRILEKASGSVEVSPEVKREIASLREKIETYFSRKAYDFAKETCESLLKLSPNDKGALSILSKIRDGAYKIPVGSRKVWTFCGVEFPFRYAPRGSFNMGSPADEPERGLDETPRLVRITKGYWILETPVTQRMWIAALGDNPSVFKGDLDLPVENVSWFDCGRFLNALNKARFAPEGWKVALPTEAQWERACRAGTSTPFYWGAKLRGDEANCNGHFPYGYKFKGKYLGRTVPVGQYEPNGWGLFDMCGNVCEWVSDWYGVYAEGPVKDPVGPSEGELRVLRGGGWNFRPVYCRSARRDKFDPHSRFNNVGFRFVIFPVEI
ncbi:MAG: SUMF1/EgtB/PvdO family nonheme iron enzyme [Thermoguttaceae bacterium]|nr:SUMF1/EgtB/PvdO family nonheme iron enzyme [Thermoguttaceae bacterium]